MNAASAGVDLEKVKRNVLAVIPGGATCDPQAVADDIRAVFCVFESEARKAVAGPSRGEVSEVTRLLVERDAAGRKKYGTTLDRIDLSHADWLQHMAEELLDAAGYALAAKRTTPPSAPVGVEAMHGIRRELAGIVRRDDGEPVWIEPNEAAAILRALAQQPAAVDGAYPTPRNRAEAVALARLALAYLGVIDAHIDAAIARCETIAAQPGADR